MSVPIILSDDNRQSIVGHPHSRRRYLHDTCMLYDVKAITDDENPSSQNSSTPKPPDFFFRHENKKHHSHIILIYLYYNVNNINRKK